MRLVFLILLFLPGLALAQSPRQMPDPFLGVTAHYQTDPSLPVQSELRDCHLFEVLAFGRGLDDLRSRLLMSCRYLSRQGGGGSDLDRATARALLGFEAAARDQMRMIDTVLRENAAEPPHGSLPIRTGWWADAYAQDRLIEAHALDLIMERAFAD
jgi:hypothetical protein